MQFIVISSTEMHTLHGGVKRRGTTIYFIEEKQPTNLDLLLNYLFIENKNSFHSVCISDVTSHGPGLQNPPARPIFPRPGPPEARI